MDSAYKSFQDLDVWQSARRYKLDIYKLADLLPKEEKFALISQIIRSARSVPANIAEGYGRYTYKDQIHFCIQARGSLYETLNHIIDALDSGYIQPELKHDLELKTKEVERLINGYITWLRKMTEKK